MNRSSRLPLALEANAWTQLRESIEFSGRRLIDLTETNPTRAGLFPEDAAAVLARAALDSTYDPDPRGIRPAREAVAARSAERGVSLDPDDVILTAGTSEAYAQVIRLLADPGDAILIPRPSYPLVEPIAALENVRTLPYDLVDEGAWRLDADSLDRIADERTRAVVVVQPNHPTGSCLDAHEIVAIETFCERRGLALLSDEVFSEFAWAGAPSPLPTLLGGRRVPTFVFDGISKSCGLPGMKLAWIALDGPPAERARAREGLAWIADLFLTVSTPAQRALPGWLAGRAPFRRAVLDRLAANRALLDAFAARRPEFRRLPAAGGWTAVLRAPAVRTDEEWSLELLRRGVAVHSGHFYDFTSGAHLVVSLLPEPAKFEAGLSILEELAAAD